MVSFALLGQLGNAEQGWLTQKLLGVTLSSAEWVLWILILASIASIAIMVERALYFSAHRLENHETVLEQLQRGQWGAAQTALASAKGMEAAVVREALQAVDAGPDSVEEIISRTLAQQRPRYEKYLSFLGTLGANAPFIGLLGTVLGIIKAFNDLGQTRVKGAQVQEVVMVGISEALVATAVGLAVAIPAVLAYNTFTRKLKTLTARTQVLGHALVGTLKGAKG